MKPIFQKQYFIKAIGQNPKTDYIKPFHKKNYLQKKKRENKNIQIYNINIQYKVNK